MIQRFRENSKYVRVIEYPTVAHIHGETITVESYSNDGLEELLRGSDVY